jgi:hypothetical protein
MCPLCESEGFLAPWPEHAMPEEQWMACQAYAGQAGTPEYVASTQFYRCDTCDGWGEVSTGARKETTSHIGCPTCSGYGYRNRQEVSPIPATYHNLPPIPPAPQIAVAPIQPVDRWGRPPGHPDYDIDPAYAGLSR